MDATVAEFLETKTIYIFEEITDTLAQRVIYQLITLAQRFDKDAVPTKDREVIVYINSPGGSISAGLSVIDVMNAVDLRIRTIGVGMVASMAALILGSGEKGNRWVFEHSDVMIHQPLSTVRGQATDILIEAKNIKRLKDLTIDLLQQYTGQPREKIAEDIERDYTMTAQEALSYGIVDKIIERKELYKAD